MAQDQLQFIATFSQVIQTLFGCLTFMITVTAIPFAFQQLNEMKRARQSDTLSKIYDHLTTTEERANRYFIYHELPEDPSRATTEQITRAGVVLISLGKVAYRVKQREIQADAVMAIFADVYIKCWSKLKPYVLYERQRRGEDPSKPYYARQVEEFAKKCVDYYGQEFPKHSLPST